jgi:A/G-specific adenine glycosylase
MAFAFKQPTLYLETNVRTVFLHELFPGEEGISDKQLEPLVLKTCSSEDPRGWYYALLDYGAHLKATHPNPSRRSKHYSKQSAFEGSNRQKRAELVRIVLANPGITTTQALKELNAFERAHKRPEIEKAFFDGLVSKLCEEGFFSLDAATNTLTC